MLADLSTPAGLGIVLGGAVGLYLLSRLVIQQVVRRIVTRSHTTWDDRFLEHQVPHRLSVVAPALLVHLTIGAVHDLDSGWATALSRVALAIVVVGVTSALFASLTAINDIYEQHQYAVQRPIKGYLQLVKLALAVAAVVLVVAILAGRSPLLLLSGIGAATAVLLLIFRDTILSLVASIQLATNDMVRVGDWITIEGIGVDGDVIDIALHTVTVRNFDQTVSFVPTHRFSSEPFRNWRGMTEAGGRRIQRSVLVDVSTIGFLADDDLDELVTWPLLTDHVRRLREELGVAEGGHRPEDATGTAARRLTNVGILRDYLVAYLRARHDLHADALPLMVRELQPTPEGLPLEVYAFTRTTDWEEYEAIQADIFDHVLAVLPRFGLAAFQHPTGRDLITLSPASPPSGG